MLVSPPSELPVHLLGQNIPLEQSSSLMRTKKMQSQSVKDKAIGNFVYTVFYIQTNGSSII